MNCQLRADSVFCLYVEVYPRAKKLLNGFLNIAFYIQKIQKFCQIKNKI